MWGWKKYVPVKERLSKAKRKMSQLKKKGKEIQPIEIQGRTIAKKFWGKQWCKHLETFSDYSNRLPRGRTYVRNGSVCHLLITKGCVEALVSGSTIYNIKVKITTLNEKKWETIKNKSKGQIGSLLELLKGALSDNVMKIVADHHEGLFPNEGEIHYTCNCPDWADMCKHVAAVLYGIGHRLDERPDLLFLLRGVNASELTTDKLVTTTEKTDDLLDDEGLSALFGIDIDEDVEQQRPQQKGKDNQITQSADPLSVTGKQLREMRMKMKLTVGELAKELKVTPASIYRWEKKEGTLNLHERSASAIAHLARE